MNRAGPAASPAGLLRVGRPLTLENVADGAEGLVVADLARAIAAEPRAPAVSLLVVCRDGPRLAQLGRALAFFAPDIEALEFPAWDCQPYDRASPHAAIVAQRMATLSRLSRRKAGAGPQSRPTVLLASVNAVVQRVPAKDVVRAEALSAAPGNMLAMDGIVGWLELNGFMRASTVREAGEYAVRGGIIDLFPPGLRDPVAPRFFRRHPGIDPHLRSRNPAQHRSDARDRTRADGGIPAHGRHHHAASAPAMCRASARRPATIRSTRQSAKAGAIPEWNIGSRCSMIGSTRCSITWTGPRWRSSRLSRMRSANASRRSPTITRRAGRR